MKILNFSLFACIWISSIVGFASCKASLPVESTAPPCDEAVAQISTEYEEHKSLSDLELRNRTGHNRSYYELVLGRHLISDADLIAIRDSHAELAITLGALAAAGRADRLSDLLRIGIPVDSTSENGTPLIVVAAGCRRAAVMELLISAGADIQAHDRQGLDSMAVAIVEDSEEVAELLISSGYSLEETSSSASNTKQLAQKLHGGKYLRMLTTK